MKLPSYIQYNALNIQALNGSISYHVQSPCVARGGGRWVSIYFVSLHTWPFRSYHKFNSHLHAISWQQWQGYGCFYVTYQSHTRAQHRIKALLPDYLVRFRPSFSDQSEQAVDKTHSFMDISRYLSPQTKQWSTNLDVVYLCDTRYTGRPGLPIWN